MEKSFSIPISRRDFMKLMGVGTMGMLVGTEAHSGEAAAGQMGMSGEGLPVLFAADVCVVGGGAAGCYGCTPRLKSGSGGAWYFTRGAGHSRMCFPLHAYLLR